MRVAFLLLVSLLCLVGCGKRGPLYLPDSPPAPAKQPTHQMTERR